MGMKRETRTLRWHNPVFILAYLQLLCFTPPWGLQWRIQNKCLRKTVTTQLRNSRTVYILRRCIKYGDYAASDNLTGSLLMNCGWLVRSVSVLFKSASNMRTYALSKENYENVNADSGHPAVIGPEWESGPDSLCQYIRLFWDATSTVEIM
jgi:hypothetical protein